MSTFPPTECGIATYTTDLIDAISEKFDGSFKFIRCRLHKGAEDTEVAFNLDPTIRSNYSKIAAQINQDKNIKLIHIQHEFGLFGGELGNYLIDFMEFVKVPVILTFHSVLPRPSVARKIIVQKLAELATGIFVMTQWSSAILEESYGIKKSLIHIVPHGTHLLEWKDKETLKATLGFRNKKILSTFGLLGQGKSIETALNALPTIIKEHPNVLYLVLGKTHPNNIHESVDSYRDYLVALVKELNIEKHVLFVNRYLELEELLKYLQATDIYLFTSRDPNQAVSGTFSYALSSACPIIATSIPHTREILSNDMGCLLDIGDSDTMASYTNKLLSNDDLRKQLSLNAFQYSRNSAWQNVAIKHMELYLELMGHSNNLVYNLSPINLDHIKKMTTKRGIIQFSKICIPDITSGYTLDDNARALILTGMHYERFREEEDLKYITIYLNFIERCQNISGTFVNYIDQHNNEHIKNDHVNLEDSNARAVWALGKIISINDILPLAIGEKAMECFLNCLSWLPGILSPRAISFCIKGLSYYLKYQKDQSLEETVENLASKMISNFDLISDRNWQWFEDYMTYANSILPEAMLHAYLITGKKAYKKIALESMQFLLSKIVHNGKFQVISNNGWHHRDRMSSKYGEQPIEVAYTIESLYIFYSVFRVPVYNRLMEVAFSWFYGNNHLSQIVYNPVTGGCNDGLEEKNINLNQGAESSICYLMARLRMEDLKKDLWPVKNLQASRKSILSGN